MVKSLIVYGSLAGVGLSLLGNPSGTAQSLLTIMSVRGVTFAATKVVDTLETDMSKVIDFTGWCLCGASILTMLGYAYKSFRPIVEVVQYSIDKIDKIADFFAKIATLVG